VTLIIPYDHEASAYVPILSSSQAAVAAPDVEVKRIILSLPNSRTPSHI
jgi:hypothetical protein